MNNERILRTAFLRAKQFKDMDTCSIAHIHDYHVLEALYSPLIHISCLDGQMYPSAAERFDVSDGRIDFYLRDDIVTIDGYRVTADDAVFSLKRLLLRNSNMHGDLSSFLDITPIKHINDSIDGIEADGLRLSLRTKAQFQLVLKFLSAIDFAIIPKISIDPTSLKIVDRRNTTGPYYLSKEDSNSFLLNAHKGHWALDKNSPEQVKIVSASSPDEIIELFEKDEIDFIGQPGDITTKEKIRLSRSTNKEVQMHATDHLFLSAFAFTDRGMALSTEERLAFASALQDGYREKLLPKKKIDGDFFADTQFLFLDSSPGSLKASSRDLYTERKASNKKLPPKKIRIAVREGSIDEFKETYNHLGDQVDFVSLPEKNTHKDNISSSDFDLFHIGFDVVDKEDSTLIAMLFHLGFFRPTEQNGFIEAYVTEPDQQKREKMVEGLHLQAICENPTIVPLVRMSLISVAKNGWHIPFPKKFIGTPFFDLEFA